MLNTLKHLIYSLKKKDTEIAILFKNDIAVDVAEGGDPVCLYKSGYFPQLIMDLENITPVFSIGYQRINLQEVELKSFIGRPISFFSGRLVL